MRLSGSAATVARVSRGGSATWASSSGHRPVVSSGGLHSWRCCSAAISVTAYAVTRAGAPKPPKRSLASAVQNALSDRPVAGVSAQFTIDQNLLGAQSSTISASPLQGATGSVWVGGGHVRLEIRSQVGTTELGFDGHRLMLYDRKHHVAYELPVSQEATDPQGARRADHRRHQSGAGQGRARGDPLGRDSQQHRRPKSVRRAHIATPKRRTVRRVRARLGCRPPRPAAIRRSIRAVRAHLRSRSP